MPRIQPASASRAAEVAQDERQHEREDVVVVALEEGGRGQQDEQLAPVARVAVGHCAGSSASSRAAVTCSSSRTRSRSFRSSTSASAPASPSGRIGGPNTIASRGRRHSRPPDDAGLGPALLGSPQANRHDRDAGRAARGARTPLRIRWRSPRGSGFTPPSGAIASTDPSCSDASARSSACASPSPRRIGI